MPTGAPAAARSAIVFVARSASACVSKATGSGLSRTASVNRLVAVLPSEEVAVTVRSTVGSVAASSVPVAERVMTPEVASMAKRASSIV